MGVQSQGVLLFKSKEISFDDIIYLLEQHHAERKRATPQLTLRVRPKVTIDASLIAYKFLGTTLHPSDGVFIISTALANRNIDVLIIGRIICSHGMTLPVSLSLALYRGLAAHVLSELRIRLLREGIESLLDGPTLSILRANVSCLMMAAGKVVESQLDPTRTIVECLEVFAVGTDLPKKAPSPPKPHDLGLLRDKCRYEKAF